MHAIILHKKISQGIHGVKPRGHKRGKSMQNKGEGGEEEQQMIEGGRISNHHIGEAEQSSMLITSSAQHQREVSNEKTAKLPDNCYLE